jgi:2-keto-4-pentenoate hydratase
VRLGDALPAAGAPYTREQVAARVDACAPAFELVEDGQVDYDRIDAPTLVVDNCWNGGVLLGDWVEDDSAHWLGESFTSSATVLELGGEELDRGRVCDAMGHPLEAVAWVANLMARRGRQTAEGTFVMTGSSGRTVFPEAGTHARSRVEGLGQVSATIVD